MEKIKLIIFMSFLSIAFSNLQDFSIPTGEDYITGEDGIKRIYVNVWGHVKNPGPYLVYEEIDIITLLSVAGGPLDGADFSEIKIISNDTLKIINLNDIIESKQKDQIQFSPYDTVIIKPTFRYYILNNASAINMVLQLINLAFSISNNN